MPDYRVPDKTPSDTKTVRHLAKLLLSLGELLAWFGKPIFLFLTTIILLLLSFLTFGLRILKVFFLLARVLLGLLGRGILFWVSLPFLILFWLANGLGYLLSPPLSALERFGRIIFLVSSEVLKYKMVFLITIVVVSFGFIVVNILSILDLPKPGQLLTRNQALSTKIYDRNGNLLYKLFRNQNRTLVRLDELPAWFRQATIAIEDANFYEHRGFSLRGIGRSLLRNIFYGEETGGSTITQQLVKNALLSPEKTLLRKLKEIVLAIRVEGTFTKDQILEMYLNEVSYGGSTYGAEEAAQVYFGKSAKNLNLGEAALLAGLPKSPTTYSPFGASPYLARARQLEVLSRMVQEGFISQEQAEKASQERLVFAPQRTDIKAPHFVMYVKQILAEKYGEQGVEEGGLTVTTSLDLSLQEKVEKILAQEVEKIKNLNISNGAVLVTTPKTGEVLAMVGSKNYYDQGIDGNFNVTTAARQPGSSIKPVNYAYALESRKYTAASIISDTPTTFWTSGGTPYSPKNYDGNFHGQVSLRTALSSSFNVPAVKVLASYGVQTMIGQGKKMGITTWNNPERFGLSLTLGGGEVKMTDMAVVYGTLANYGQRVELSPILKVTDHTDKVLEENFCVEENSEKPKLSSLFPNLLQTVQASEASPLQGCRQQVIDARVAFILTDILRDNEARSTAFGPDSLLVIPNHPEVAVKTGTTQNLRDNWAIGYTKDYVVAAWVGNNNNSPMAYVASGVTGATPIWHLVMKMLLEGKGGQGWEIPQGIVQLDICQPLGTLPCEGCSGKKEYFLAGTEPKTACVQNTEIPTEKREQILPAQDNSGF